MTNERYEGKCVWFQQNLAYGFIECPRLEDHVFVHYSQIKMEGFKNLEAGQRVEFSIGEHEGRRQAVDVVPLEVSDGSSGRTTQFK